MLLLLYYSVDEVYDLKIFYLFIEVHISEFSAYVSDIYIHIYIY